MVMDCTDEVLNVEFEGRPAEDSDLDGIKILLRQLFLVGTVDYYELAKLIISQNYVGSVLHQVLSDSDDEDEDEEMGLNEDTSLPVFGILTALNITEKKSLDVVQHLKTLLLEKSTECSDSNIHDQLESMLNNENEQVGFLINERILASTQIAIPNFECLWKDIEKANNKNMKYNFTKYVLLTRSSSVMSTKNKNKDNIEFINPEDKIFLDHSLFSFNYSVHGQHDTLVDMNSSEILNQQQEPLRSVIVFEACELPAIMNEMKTLCDF